MSTATTKPTRTIGRNCRQYVQSRKPFKNSNNTLYGCWIKPDIYAVFSYGNHWPLFAWEGGTWYANCDKYSMTTSKHYSQAHPWSDPAPLPLHQKDMLRLIEHGITGVAVGVPSSHEATYEQFRQHKELYSV